jgi:hypothetical protein
VDDSGAQTPSGKLATLPFRGTWRRSLVQSSQQAPKVMEGGLSFQGEIHLSRGYVASVHVSGVLRAPSARQSPKSLKLAQRSRRRKTPTVETTSRSSHTARGRDTASCCVEERRISDFYMLADIIAILAIRARRYHYRGQLASKELHRNFNDVNLAFSSW